MLIFSFLFFCPSPRAQDVPPEVLRQREVKWLDMLSNWDKWMVKRHKKVRQLLRVGTFIRLTQFHLLPCLDCCDTVSYHLVVLIIPQTILNKFLHSMWQLLIMLLANRGLVSTFILLALCPVCVNPTVTSILYPGQACWGFGLYWTTTTFCSA